MRFVFLMMNYFIQAIGRLSSGSLNCEVASLATRKLDTTYKQNILNILQRLEIKIQQLQSHIPSNVQGISSYQINAENSNSNK